MSIATVSSLPQATSITPADRLLIENNTTTSFITVEQLQNTIVQTTSISLTVALSDLQSTIDALPKILISNVTINVLPGTINDTINISGFIGSILSIYCTDSSGTVVNTAGATTHNITSLNCDTNSNRINITGFNCTNTTGNAIGVTDSVASYYFSYCSAAEGINTDISNVGISCQNNGGILYFSNCTISNKYIAYYSYSDNAIIIHNSTGSNNDRVYRAVSGGQIRIRSVGSITGNSEFTRAEGGSIIKEDGTLL